MMEKIHILHQNMLGACTFIQLKYDWGHYWMGLFNMGPYYMGPFNMGSCNIGAFFCGVAHIPRVKPILQLSFSKKKEKNPR